MRVSTLLMAAATVGYTVLVVAKWRRDVGELDAMTAEPTGSG